MRMSDTFYTLPICGQKLAYELMYSTRPLGPSTAEAAAHAVNNHDALVAALDNLVKGRSTCYAKQYDEHIRTAAELLEQIKNDK